MTRPKNTEGHCDERSIDVGALNLCDYFQGKRRNSKARCRNCTHFHILVINSQKIKSEDNLTKQDDIV